MRGVVWKGVVAAVLAGSAQAATITVTTTNDSVAADAQCSLREAITAANTDAAFNGCPAGSGADIIVLPAGEYRLTRAGADEDGNLTGDLDIRSSLQLQGAGADLTRIRGDRVDRLFDVRQGIPAVPVEVRIAGMTLRNGEAALGGAILVGSGAGLRVEGVSIVNNIATQGGAIAVQGALSVSAAAFHANSATRGGALWSAAGSSVELRNVTFDGNTSSQSGSAAAFDGDAVLNNVTMSQNVADSDSDDTGDGALEANGTVTLSNTLIARNLDLSLGGASTVNPDCATGVAGTLASTGYNLVGTLGEACTLAPQASDQTGTPAAPINPRLQPFAVYGGTVEVFLPLVTSPAVERGSPAAMGEPGACEPVDARGIARPQASRCDIGAAELDDLVFRDGFDPPLP
ncbi:choice-of-anchor Q domain-containing protein [Dokdonella sp. MW10]|uniref:choice-of-anchor Q domain-containing protein n=1 Tax=Dokdonella sp. MW10 TaxID=2992926 RepID=UPI003F7DA4C4